MQKIGADSDCPHEAGLMTITAVVRVSHAFTLTQFRKAYHDAESGFQSEKPHDERSPNEWYNLPHEI